MCGITGYVGERPGVRTVIDMLRRLEYRGYDSAGVAVATVGGGDIEVVRIGLQEREEELEGRVAIGRAHPRKRRRHPFAPATP